MKAMEAFPVEALKAHISLNVSNVTRSIEFYRALFGIEPARVRSDYAKFDVVNPPLNLSLNQAVREGAGTLSHLGIQVDSSDHVRAVTEGWRAAGLDPREEMKTACCYALQDKAWVADPDGNEWEVFVVLGEAEANTECCVDPAAERAAKAASNIEILEPAVAEEACCVPGSGCC